MMMMLIIPVVRVEDPKTKLNKFVLIGWVSVLFGLDTNFSVVKVHQNIRRDYSIHISSPLPNSSRYVLLTEAQLTRQGYHVQITARNESDIDPATIMNKVADSSGSKYSQLMSKFESSPQAKRGSGVSPSVVIFLSLLD